VPRGGLPALGVSRRHLLSFDFARQGLTEFYIGGDYFQSIEPPDGVSIERILPEALLPFV
jgi:hypothetical protein